MTNFDPDLTHFRQEGYQVVPGLIDPEIVGGIGRFLEQRMQASLEVLRQHLPFETHEELVAEIDTAVHDGRAEEWDAKIGQIMSGHFDLETRLSRELWAILESEPFLETMVQLLGDDGLRMHLPPTARFVLPGNRHAGAPTHQDWAYNTHMKDFVTVWVPMVPTDDACGGVCFHHGRSEREELGTERRNALWLEGLPDRGHRKVHLPMKPGDVLFLNDMIVHESMPNLSTTTRLSIDYRFFSARGTSSKHCLDVEKRQVLEPQ